MSDEGSSNTLKYVGIGCAVITLLGMCGVGACVTCAGVGAGGIMVAVEAPAEATHGLLRDLRSGNVAGGYARMSSSYRAVHTEADFAAAVAAHPVLTTSTDATISSRNIHGATATMGGTLDGAGGVVGMVSAELSQEGEAWMIDALTVDGAPL